MIVNIQISDSAYAQLLNGTKRLQGTLALVNPTEGNFHEHNKTWYEVHEIASRTHHRER